MGVDNFLIDLGKSRCYNFPFGRTINYNVTKDGLKKNLAPAKSAKCFFKI